ncbi:MAG: 30S ribosomal protein S4e [archaeon]
MAQHMKRIVSPNYWKTGKKTFYWVTSPRPGKHPQESAIPLIVVLRDMLALAKTAREVKAILKGGNVAIDGKVCTDGKVGVGLMDVIAIPTVSKVYRVLPSGRGLILSEIPEADGHVKVLKVIRKTTVKGGKTQVTFHDGRNVLMSKEDGSKIKTGHSALFDLKEKKVSKFIALGRGTTALVFDGVHSGKILDISEIKAGSAYAKPTVLLESGRKTLETLKDYVIAIGTGKPEITIPENDGKKGGKA